MMNRKKYLLSILSILVTVSLLLASCGDETPAEKQLFAMDTSINLTAYGDGADTALDEAEREILRLDGLLNAEDPQSEIGRLNADGRGTLSADSGTLIREGLKLYEQTSGLFDIAIHPIMQVWGFTSGEYRVPDRKELEALLPHTDASKIVYDPQTRRAEFGDSEMSIDLGGIAKGYASERIMQVYREAGIDSGLVNLGGNVQVLGTKPDGSKWCVAIQDPDDEGYIGTIDIADMAVITSGAYERNFTEGGKTYHHIIDPRSGYPAESGLKSVTIVSKNGTLADALSTSLYVMGREEAVKYWRKDPDLFDFIMIDDDNRIWISSPIADDFVCEDHEVNEVPLS